MNWIFRIKLKSSNFLKAKNQDIVLNCSAYNFVDKAEAEPEAAFRTNAEGVLNLALASKDNNIFLVHYSSDYVFDGTKTELYNESDLANPINIYGESKLAGGSYSRSIARLFAFPLKLGFLEGTQISFSNSVSRLKKISTFKNIG